MSGNSLLPFPGLAAAIVVVVGATDCAEERVQFNRDVRPILSDKCFFCHGPDSKKREADLRLDVREAAVKAKAIVVDQPDQSELLKRVLSEDPDERMPPVASKLDRLTPQEVATLRKWIEQGAEYENHWAFIPLEASDASRDATACDRSVRRCRTCQAKIVAATGGGSDHADPPVVVRHHGSAAVAGRGRSVSQG